MKITLEDPTLFAKSIDLVSELVLEVKMKVNEFGLSIVAIDPANVSMVALRVPKSSFKEFEADEETLGVNLENLRKVLRRCGKSGELTLEKNQNMLDIRIEGRAKKSFSLSLMDVQGEEKEFPSHLEYASKVDISSEEFIESVEDCAVVGDACSFITQEDKFIVESKEMNSARTEFSSDLAKIEGANSKSRYTIEYLHKFLKAGKSFERTVINFANDHPIRFDFNSEVLSLSFLLAPRIETDD